MQSGSARAFRYFEIDRSTDLIFLRITNKNIAYNELNSKFDSQRKQNNLSKSRQQTVHSIKNQKLQKVKHIVSLRPIAHRLKLKNQPTKASASGKIKVVTCVLWHQTYIMFLLGLAFLHRRFAALKYKFKPKILIPPKSQKTHVFQFPNFSDDASCFMLIME